MLSIGETKTASSRRTLSMPTRVMAELKVHKTKQTTERFKATAWIGQDLIFCNVIGGLLDPSNLRRGFSALTEKAKIGH